jgi:hypothetical protein
MATKARTSRRARVRRKNYRIDVIKLERTRRILGTRTETETIHRALDLVADEAALVEALRAGRIAGAGLDVFEEEPKLHPGLLALENLALTPHVGSASRATRLRMATRAAENCVAALRGHRPPNLVNPEAWRSA